jgi:N6-adenosine-specific RNA methylase IME4
VPCPAPEKLCSSIIRAPRTGLHSAKPKIMDDIIERMYPGLRKIELFARGLARRGWTNWGLEADCKKPIKVAHISLSQLVDQCFGVFQVGGVEGLR